jgi:hypothetical protein
MVSFSVMNNNNKGVTPSVNIICLIQTFFFLHFDSEPRKISRKQNTILSDAVRQAVVTSNWPKYDADRQKYLQISARSKDVRDHYRAHKSAFWTELIPKLNIGDLSSPQISKEHHELAEFDKLDTYDGAVRSLAFLALPPPPLPPSTIPPPWRNKTRSRATSSATSSTQGNEVVVTAVEPELQGLNQTAMNTGLIIGIAIGATLLIVNALVCVSVHYQRKKLQKKYPKTVRTPSLEKRNGVVPSAALEHAEHVETLLPATSGGSPREYSAPGTPMPAAHYGLPQSVSDRPTRTFNTFSDQHRFMAGSVTGSDSSMPASLPASTLLRVMPHLVPSGNGGDLLRKPSMDTLRKGGSVSSQLKLQQDAVETDETAV